MPNSLKHYVTSKMKVSGPYQPLIIKLLLQHNGKVSLSEIATELAKTDPIAIDYFISKLKIHPKSVLKKHKIAVLKNDFFQFDDVDFTTNETNEIIEICDKKLLEYYSKNISENENTGWGRMRLKLLENTPFCSLCGAKPTKTNDIELDIDHIFPVSQGGTNEESNLQVLCHRCNRAKGNYLLKSSKDIHETNLNKKSDCIFCDIEVDRIFAEDDYTYAIKDKFAVSNGHSLVITKRHVSNALDINDSEIVSLHKHAKKIAADLAKDDSTILGFNLGFNCGITAGQTIPHAHYHLIPRRKGDVIDPTGGIRNVIAGRGRY